RDELDDDDDNEDEPDGDLPRPDFAMGILVNWFG
ncbi:hypothetical protein Tco_1160465, partial [Tanacetum coccineum]